MRPPVFVPAAPPLPLPLLVLLALALVLARARAAPCTPDYESCGPGVLSPVPPRPCCSAAFYCYTRGAYFSQCRPVRERREGRARWFRVRLGPHRAPLHTFQSAAWARRHARVALVEPVAPRDKLRAAAAAPAEAAEAAEAAAASRVEAVVPVLRAEERLALRARVLRAIPAAAVDVRKGSVVVAGLRGDAQVAHALTALAALDAVLTVQVAAR